MEIGIAGTAAVIGAIWIAEHFWKKRRRRLAQEALDRHHAEKQKRRPV